MDQTILDKIQKLLALSTSSNPHEAAAAYATAYKLLAKHQLTLADLEHKDNITEATVSDFQGQRFVTWKSDLISFLSKINHCYQFLNYELEGNPPRKKTTFKLVGHPSDIEIVNYLFQSISQQIEIMSAAALRGGLGHGKTFTNNFKHGAVSVVFQRLTEAQQVVRVEANQTEQGRAALVKVETRTQEAKVWAQKKYHIKSIKNIKPMTRDEGGFELGQIAGSRVNLAKGLPTVKPKLLT